MRTFDDIGVAAPEVLLPRPGADLPKWAVVACDQYTSEPPYWQAVEQLVGAAPSTLRLTLPEIHLEQPDEAQRISNIQAAMRQVLAADLLRAREGLVYVERQIAGRRRKGVVLALDLDQYDYSRGSTSLIRATEGTIVERLPPRMKVRAGAALELPHILVLIDDAARSVIEPLAADTAQFEPLYDFELMQGGGHLRGWGVDAAHEARVIAALRALAEPQAFAAKYGLAPGAPVLLFAMGDGNHSLATAKAVWQQMKPHVAPDHPARWALVEIENVHDDALVFEPIHRVLFGLRKDFYTELAAAFTDTVAYRALPDAAAMQAAVDAAADVPGAPHVVGLTGGGRGFGVAEFSHPAANLAVGTVQPFLDALLHGAGAHRIDYVHGADVAVRLGGEPGNLGIVLPAMSKSALFKTVIADGALPRKTFSMGEANEKRFYMEARRIA